jgi:hypothetical protein
MGSVGMEAQGTAMAEALGPPLVLRCVHAARLAPSTHVPINNTEVVASVIRRALHIETKA